MITREQVNDMILKHFGDVENKEQFLDELYSTDNILVKGRLEDENGKSTNDFIRAFSFGISVEMMGESFYATLYNANNINNWNGVSFWYYNQKDNDNDLIFHCKSIGEQNEFEIDSNNGGVRNKLSIAKIKELFNLEYSINQISKYFK